MTLSVTHVTEQASPLRGLLPLWVGAGIYALFLLAGNRLLIDPDTMWQITVGQWIIDHRSVPTVDVKFLVDHNAASGLMKPENLFRLFDEYNIEATLMRTQSAATRLLDHVDGWQKIYSDDIATIHLRKAGAVHTREPAVDPKAK